MEILSSVQKRTVVRSFVSSHEIYGMGPHPVLGAEGVAAGRDFCAGGESIAPGIRSSTLTDARPRRDPALSIPPITSNSPDANFSQVTGYSASIREIVGMAENVGAGEIVQQESPGDV